MFYSEQAAIKGSYQALCSASRYGTKQQGMRCVQSLWSPTCMMVAPLADSSAVV